jgi:hypothetical protein
MSPYQLVYEKTCHLSVELEFKAHWAIRRWNMDFEAAGTKRKMQLFKLEAYHNAKIYKERTKRWHDKRIIKKEFNPGDHALLFNSRVRLFGHRKLRSKWEGPYKVVNSSSHGAVTLQNDEGTLFKVNGQCLKIFLEPNKESEDLDEIYFLCFPTNINFRLLWAILGFLGINTWLEHPAPKITARHPGRGPIGPLTRLIGPYPLLRSASFRPRYL